MTEESETGRFYSVYVSLVSVKSYFSGLEGKELFHFRGCFVYLVKVVE